MGVMRWGFGSLLLLAALVATGCGDEFEGEEDGSGGGAGAAPPTCNADPWSCPDTQTCWINGDGTAFQCLNEGAGEIGEACMFFAGSPTCRNGLICMQTEQSVPGICVRFMP